MTLKRLVLPVLALALMAAVSPVARADVDVLGTCTPANFQTGAPCQGPDGDPHAYDCVINTWVAQASCVLHVPTGVTHQSTATLLVTSESDQTPAYDVKIIVPSTGEVLKEVTGGNGEPGKWCNPIRTVACVQGPSFNKMRGTAGWNDALPQRTTDTVICQITSTWTHYGAVYSPAAEAESLAAGNDPTGLHNPTFWSANNYIDCRVW